MQQIHVQDLHGCLADSAAQCFLVESMVKQ